MFEKTMFANMMFWWGQFFAVTCVAYNYSKDYSNFTYSPGS